MKITQIMSRQVECVEEQDTVVTAAAKMRDLDVGALPVVDSTEQLSGIVTDRDIVLRAIAEDRDASKTTVGQIMTSGAITCKSDESVVQVAGLMEDNQVRRIVVVDDSDKAVGIVSLGDIAVKNDDMELAGEMVERISKSATAAG